MKNLFEIGNQYAKESDWKDFALLKLCLCAMGIVIGTQVTPKYKKTVIVASIGVFIATYIPLMTKVYNVISSQTLIRHIGNAISSRGQLYIMRNDILIVSIT